MASNRVERQLMRQRGAGTRKIKEVDFGFSLGLGPPAEESSQPPASQPTNEPESTPAPAPSLNDPPPPETTTTTTTNTAPSQAQPNLSPTRPNAPQNSAVQRTPGSARNKLPPRRSTFDIPGEDESELERSSKRRKIESPKDTSPLISAQVETQNIEAVVQNGSIEEPVAARSKESTSIPIRTVAATETEPTTQEPPAEAPSIPTNEAVELPEIADQAQLQPEVAEQPAPRTNGTASPSSDTSSRRGKGRKKKSRSPPSQKNSPSAEPAEQVDIQPTELSKPPEPTEEPQEPSQPKAPRAREKRTRSRTPASEQQAEKPIGDAGPEPADVLPDQGLVETEPQRAREKRTRSQTPASAQLEKSPTADQAPTEDASSGLARDTAAKGRRGRKPRSAEPTKEVPGPAQQPEDMPSVEADTEPEPEAVTTEEPSEIQQDQPNGIDNGRKRAGRPKKQNGEFPPASEEPVADTKKRQREDPGQDRDLQKKASPEQDQTDSSASRPSKRRKQRKEPEPSRPEEQAAPEPEKRPRVGRRKQHQEGPTPPDERPESDADAQKTHEKEQRSPKPGRDEQPEPEPAVERARAGRGRKRREERAPTPEQEPQLEIEQVQARKGKKRQEPAPTPAQESQPEVEQAQGKKGKKRQERAPTPEQEPQAEVEQTQARKGKKRREERLPTPEQDPQPEVERAQIKEGKKRQERAPTPEQEQEPEPEVEREAQSERPKDKKRGRRPATQSDETRDATEQPQAAKRKPRQPRGETVPVTVHRLANPASLGGAPVESASEDEADELADSQTTKLPNRVGVNPADVLAQICRETLEKTLTTLKNGIANETNTARRAEWTLRRKAVETFGTELEGRLFDLSEMLDSNFMLSAKVKKAKRNMMDMRSRLDRVRRERETVALKMDAVRREHSKEEHAGMARSTINHSLHNLDLALERGRTQGQNRSTDEPLTAGLELRLRNVARNVSSSVSGAQGGLLNQIKTFNAQLEATARQLEG